MSCNFHKTMEVSTKLNTGISKPSMDGDFYCYRLKHPVIFLPIITEQEGTCLILEMAYSVLSSLCWELPPFLLHLQPFRLLHICISNYSHSSVSYSKIGLFLSQFIDSLKNISWEHNGCQPLDTRAQCNTIFMEFMIWGGLLFFQISNNFVSIRNNNL